MVTVRATIRRSRSDGLSHKAASIDQGTISVEISYRSILTMSPRVRKQNKWKNYPLCSLLLRIGKILGTVPPQRTPTVYVSSIFDNILEKWQLVATSTTATESGRKINNLSDINEGDSLVLICGKYVDDTTSGSENSSSSTDIDFCSLLPSWTQYVTVTEITANESDSDDSIEDVTDLYVKRTRSPPEVIDIDGGEKGLKKGTTTPSSIRKKRKIKSGSCQDDSDVEDVTDIMSEKKKMEELRKMKEAEILDQSDSEDCQISKKIQNGKSLPGKNSPRKPERGPHTPQSGRRRLRPR
mmetsp:Transcript_219/g.415  ORF Transcript_219/g.415 Transcript_219/m.415 type:complete len:297 (-) Transcript_219:73-963(-)